MADDKAETLKGRDRFCLVSRSAILRNVVAARFLPPSSNESRDLSIRRRRSVKAMDVRAFEFIGWEEGKNEKN